MPATARRHSAQVIRPPSFHPEPPRRRTNMSRILRNQTRRERFADQDSDVEVVGIMIHDSGMTVGEICKAVYEYSRGEWMPHYRTVENLMLNKTKRPHNNTLKWIGLALGWRRTWQRIQ